MRPLTAAGLAVAIALLIALAWWERKPGAIAVPSALEGTVGVRVTWHDRLGMPTKVTGVRQPGQVRRVVSALGVDAHPKVDCPEDYASADVGLVLSGRDVYSKRNVYVWDLAGSPRVITVTSSGCRGGAPTDAEELRRALSDAEKDASR